MTKIAQQLAVMTPGDAAAAAEKKAIAKNYIWRGNGYIKYAFDDNSVLVQSGALQLGVDIDDVKSIREYERWLGKDVDIERAEIDRLLDVVTKAYWVSQSQRAGRKLSILSALHTETPPAIQIVAIIIPPGVNFAELRLARDASGAVNFDWAPIERICAASGVDVALLRDQPEGGLAGLFAAWHRQHLAAGGQPDPVYADLVGEVAAEMRRVECDQQQPPAPPP